MKTAFKCYKTGNWCGVRNDAWPSLIPIESILCIGDAAQISFDCFQLVSGIKLGAVECGLIMSHSVPPSIYPIMIVGRPIVVPHQSSFCYHTLEY